MPNYKCLYSEVDCDECERRSFCEAYMLIMDLTAERHVCPLMDIMEHCVYDDSVPEGYLPRTYEECVELIKSRS